VHLVWKRIEPVASDSVLMLTPTVTLADCPQLDVICVPGGVGTDDMVNDEEMLVSCAGRQREQSTSPRSARDRWCWGCRSAAGLPRDHALVGDGSSCAIGRDADQDAGVRRPQPRHRRRRYRWHRFCADAGVAAGRPQTAEAIQLRLEYNPAPPFNAGSPDTAPPEVLALMKAKIAPFQQRRGEAIDRAAARLATQDVAAS